MEQYALEEMLSKGRGRMGNLRGRLSGLKAGDMDMAARNSALGREVPGLKGVHFAPDLASGMATAAKSNALWNSKDRMSHPAIGFSRGMAGIDGLAGGQIENIRGATEARLADKGITRDAQGNWGLSGSQVGPGASVPSTGVAGPPRKGNTAPVTGLPTQDFPSAGQGVGRETSPTHKDIYGTGGTGLSSSANGGNVSMGDVPANTKLNIDVSGGTQITNGQRSTGTPGKQSVGRVGGSPASSLASSIQNTVMGKTGTIGGSGRSSTGLGGLADTIRNAVNQQVQTPSDGIFSARPPGMSVGPSDPGAGMLRRGAPRTSTPAPTQSAPTQQAPSQQGVPQYPALDPRSQGGQTASGLPLIKGGERLAPAAEGVFAPVSVGGETPAQPVSGGSSYMHPDSQLGKMQQAQLSGQGVGVAAPSGSAAPTGTIPVGSLSLGNAQGASWDNLAPVEGAIQETAAKYGIDPRVIRAAAMMESNGIAYPDQSGAPASTGIMQIEQQWWDHNGDGLDDQLGYDLNTPEGQIGMWGALMSGNYPGVTPAGDNPIDRHVSNYFGSSDPAYQEAYRSDLNTLVAMQPVSGPPQQTQQLPQGNYPQPGVGDVGSLGVPIIEGPQRLPGSAVSGQAPVQPGPGGVNQNAVPGSGVYGGTPLPPGGVPNPAPGSVLGQNTGLKVGAAAAGNTPPIGQGGQTGVLPGSGQTIGSMVVDPVTGNLVPGPSATGRNRPIGGTVPGGAPITPATTIASGTGPGAGGPLDPGTTQGGGVYNTIATPVDGSIAPSGEAISVDDAQSTGWINAILPGHQDTYLAEGGYGFGDDVGAYCNGRPCYENYENWGCGTCHTGTDIPTNGSEPFTATQAGTVVCSNGQGPGGGTSYSNGAGGAIGCTAYGSADTGAPGQITVETPDGALLTYGHANVMNVMPGDEVTPGMELGMSGNLNGYHVHAEVQLPIGPGGSYVLVDPNLYYSGYYAAQGFSPTSGNPQATQPSGKTSGYMGDAALARMRAEMMVDPNGTQQITGGGSWTDYRGAPPVSQSPPASQATYTTDSQSYNQQPAPAAQPMPAPSYYDQGAVQPTTGQVTTDSAGRQYETMADGTMRLIYDPSW